MRELQARLRLAESARTRDPEYGGDFSGEDEDAWQDALGAAIRAIALEDGTGTAPSSVRTPAAAETEASADAAEAFFLRAAAAPPPRGGLRRVLVAERAQLRAHGVEVVLGRVQRRDQRLVRGVEARREGGVGLVRGAACRRGVGGIVSLRRRRFRSRR